MPAIRSAPRSKVAPCTARLANQPSTQPTPSIVKAATTVRSKVGILPHTRKCVAFAKTILRGVRRRQALDRDGRLTQRRWPHSQPRSAKDLVRASATFGWKLQPRDGRGPLGCRAGPAGAVVAPLGVQQGKPQQQRLQGAGQSLGRRHVLAQYLANEAGGLVAQSHGLGPSGRNAKTRCPPPSFPRERKFIQSNQIVNWKLTTLARAELLRRQASAQSARRPNNSRHFSGSSSRKNSLAVWAWALLPGPQTMAGGRPSWKRPASVQ